MTLIKVGKREMHVGFYRSEGGEGMCGQRVSPFSLYSKLSEGGELKVDLDESG